MRAGSVIRELSYVVVWIPFALCGVWSAQVFPAQDKHPALLFPLPFAGLCAILFLRTSGWRLIWSVSLSLPVYWIAYAVALILAPPSGWLYFPPLCAGGFVGGAGLALSFGLSDRRLLARRLVLRAGAVGALSALGFLAWFVPRMSNGWSGPQVEPDPGLLRYGFAAWQAGVGTYFYTVCRGATPRNPPSPASGRDPR